MHKYNNILQIHIKNNEITSATETDSVRILRLKSKTEMHAFHFKTTQAINTKNAHDSIK